MELSIKLAEGLYYAVGKNVSQISAVLQGSPNAELQGNADFSHFVNHIQLAQISSSISVENFKNYLTDSHLGFNKTNNELLVSNPNHNYSYVYSFESSSWHKISKSFNYFINSYPELLGVRSNISGSGVFNLSLEEFVSSVPVLLATRPCKVESNLK